jgi:predicted AlkP superfamily phosphohydrolase/phosphomutase
MNLTRRDFIRRSGGAATLGALGFPFIGKSRPGDARIMILGVDGMDPKMTARLMGEGQLPNCRRLAEQGSFLPLQTTDPPQSPVAWSSFISGTNPGGHGIFDFIARDSETLQPHLSTSKVEGPAKTLSLGRFSLPLGGGGPQLLREGPTLWDLLTDAGYDATAFRAPVSFPVVSKRAHTLSGITTPDLLGTYGTFTLYSTVPGTRSHEPAGGRIVRVRMENHLVDTVLSGPLNTYRSGRETVDIPLVISADPQRPVLRIDLSGHRILLKQGEWSEWITLSFPMVPGLAETAGICRLYAKQVQPYLELYVTPLNIDPAHPAMPIGSPPHYARDLAKDMGYFYTQGMPEDTAALSSGVFDDDEFRAQASYVLDERLRFLRHELDRYRGGFLYFYFSTLDLNSHAFWRTLDTEHPLYTPELAARHGDVLPELYRRIDEGIGWALDAAGNNTLVAVVSDHGFVPFRRQVQLNGWLADNGFARLRAGAQRGATSFFEDTEWGRTQAYGLGINSLYLNLKRREPEGIVNSGVEYEEVRTRLIDRLLAMRDPENDDQPIRRVLRREELYSGPYVDRAPDLVVLYNENYRASWDTILGAYPAEAVSDNLDPWSGDHCMDSAFLPGVFICNRSITQANPALEDLAPTILNLCKVDVPPTMTGRDLGVT